MNRKLWTKGIISGLCAAMVMTGCGFGLGTSSESTGTENTQGEAREKQEAGEKITAKESENNGTQGDRYENGREGNDLVTAVPERGLIFTLSEEYLSEGVELTPYNYNLGEFPVADVFYYYRPVTDPLIDQLVFLSEEDPALLTDEYTAEIYEQIWAHSRCLMRLTLIPEAEYSDYLDNGKSMDDLAEMNHTEEFGRNDGYVYLLSIPDHDLTGLSEAEISQYERCRAYMEEIKNNLEFIPVELESNETALGDQMPEFHTIDLDGNAVTNALFSQKELTVVNVWGTFCYPCIEEMPQLAKWSREMPENVQLIGLVTDIEGEGDQKHRDLAKDIVRRAGAEFPQLIANEDFTEWMKGIVGVPTTFFVDKNGQIVGEPIVGADVDGYQKFVEEYFHE